MCARAHGQAGGYAGTRYLHEVGADDSGAALGRRVAGEVAAAAVAVRQCQCQWARANTRTLGLCEYSPQPSPGWMENTAHCRGNHVILLRMETRDIPIIQQEIVAFFCPVVGIFGMDPKTRFGILEPTSPQLLTSTSVDSQAEREVARGWRSGGERRARAPEHRGPEACGAEAQHTGANEQALHVARRTTHGTPASVHGTPDPARLDRRVGQKAPDSCNTESACGYRFQSRGVAFALPQKLVTARGGVRLIFSRASVPRGCAQKQADIRQVDWVARRGTPTRRAVLIAAAPGTRHARPSGRRSCAGGRGDRPRSASGSEAEASVRPAAARRRQGEGARWGKHQRARRHDEPNLADLRVLRAQGDVCRRRAVAARRGEGGDARPQKVSAFDSRTSTCYRADMSLGARTEECGARRVERAAEGRHPDHHHGRAEARFAAGGAKVSV